MALTVDDTHRVSVLGPPLGPPVFEIYDVSIHPQNTVRGDEEWECRFSIRNVGSSAGWFKYEATGDNILISPLLPLVLLEPGQWARNEPLPIIGIGPGNITIKALLATPGQGESHDVNVGEGAVAASSSQNTLAGASFDVIVGSATGPPEARLMNPDFPSAVGPDETWMGYIERHNVGSKIGWFFWELKGGDNITRPRARGGILELVPGGYKLLWVNGIGPATFTVTLHAVEWVEEDSVVAMIGPHMVTGAGGELRNLVISREYVLDGQDWIGGVQVWNIGDASGNFRVVFTGDITGTSPTFALDPGDHAAVYFEDVGPKVFTITTQREVDTVWVDDHSRNAEASKMVTCRTAIVYVGIKHDGEDSLALGSRLEIGDHVFIYSPLAAQWIFYELAEGKSYYLQVRHMGQRQMYRTRITFVPPPGQDWVGYNFPVNILDWPHPHPGY